MRNKLTDLQKIEIVEKYQSGKNGQELATEYKVTRQAIHYILKYRKILSNKSRSELSRKYKLDETYFDKIDSEGKAYFLGLLYADGCNGDNHSVCISLQEIDVEILNKFNTEINSNRPLNYIDNSKNKNRKNSFRLTINSVYMSLKLIELGCIPRKSLVLQFPTEEQVPPHLIRHFIRGYFDGDGSVSLYYLYKGKRLKTKSTIVSTNEFCRSVENILKEYLSVNCYIDKRFKKSTTTTRQLNISGNQQVFKFLNWIYKDCAFYIDRKYLKFKEIEMEMTKRNLIKGEDQ